jgi:hypothetical protein
MIDAVTKQKLLDEISKFGNIYLACLRVGISRADYYRWIKEDKNFKENAEDAVRVGRENFIDICEGSLIKNVKNGNQRAVEYGLRFNSERYMPEKFLNRDDHRYDIVKQVDEKTEEIRRLLEKWQKNPGSGEKTVDLTKETPQELSERLEKEDG